MQERLKREYTRANKTREAGVVDTDDEEDDENKLTKEGKTLKKLMRNYEKNSAYGSDDEENPYASSVRNYLGLNCSTTSLNAPVRLRRSQKMSRSSATNPLSSRSRKRHRRGPVPKLLLKVCRHLSDPPCLPPGPPLPCRRASVAILSSRSALLARRYQDPLFRPEQCAGLAHSPEMGAVLLVPMVVAQPAPSQMGARVAPLHKESRATSARPPMKLAAPVLAVNQLRQGQLHRSRRNASQWLQTRLAS